jgi:hypothetical protein
MKNTVSMMVYTITFMAMYFVLSLFGCLFFTGNEHPDYDQVLGDTQWFIMYTLFLGWWVALIPARDCYISMEKKERSANTF